MLVAGVSTFVVMLILFCCHKVLKRWLKEYDEDTRNNPRSRATEDSETGNSDQEDDARKANTNEGYHADISMENVKGTKTSSTVNRKEALYQLFSVYSQNNKEARLGCTRVNNDGSMDTRF